MRPANAVICDHSRLSLGRRIGAGDNAGDVDFAAMARAVIECETSGSPARRAPGDAILPTARARS
jgi:hypothetical protein